MHFVKAVILFAGLAAAAPAVSSTPPKVSATPSKAVAAASSKPASSEPASSKPAAATPSANVKTPTAAQAKTITDDLSKFNDNVLAGISALNAFTGGDKVGEQATAVSKAGDAWQQTILKLMSDASALKGYSKFSASDSTAVASGITGALTTNTVKLFNLVKDKKALFTQVNAKQNVYNGLQGIQGELAQIGQTLEPLLQSKDLASIEPAGKQIFSASNAAIAAYSN